MNTQPIERRKNRNKNMKKKTKDNRKGSKTTQNKCLQ